MSKPEISVVVPVYNEEKYIRQAISYLGNQDFEDYEIIFVDDGSTDDTMELIRKSKKDYKKICLLTQSHKGAAAARNRGIKNAKSNLIAFTDTDCLVPADWLSKIYRKFEDKKMKVIMGNTRIPKSNFFGDSVAALGFPGGANAGFENMWKVDSQRFTEHITSCNFACRKSVFENFGGFDESFPMAGGEDPELSFRLAKQGVKIKYFSDILLYHVPCKSLREFVKWHYKRGFTNYFFKKKVGEVGGFVRLRLWSSWNIVRKFFWDAKFFLIISLLALSFILQQLGYFKARFSYE